MDTGSSGVEGPPRFRIRARRPFGRPFGGSFILALGRPGVASVCARLGGCVLRIPEAYQFRIHMKVFGGVR